MDYKESELNQMGGCEEVSEYTRMPELEYAKAPEPEYTRAPESEYARAPEPQYTRVPEPEYARAPEPEYKKAPEYSKTSESDGQSEYSRRPVFDKLLDIHEMPGYERMSDSDVQQESKRLSEYRNTLQDRGETKIIPMVGEEPMSVVEWLTFYILCIIPVVNIVVFLGCLFGWGKKSRTNFVRAELLLSIIMCGFFAFLYFTFPVAVQSLLKLYSMGR